MRHLTLAMLVILLLPSSAVAQAPDLGSFAGGMTQLYQSVRRNLLQAAELMPAERYGFQPTADVRTFGQIVGHLANTQYNFCAPVRDGERPSPGNAELLDTKAQLVAALTAAMEFCDPAYAESDTARLAAPARFGSVDVTVGYLLTFNVAHNNEHYGNIVTYLRMNGIVPPSSARSR